MEKSKKLIAKKEIRRVLINSINENLGKDE
jgi:hypothetical protein